MSATVESTTSKIDAVSKKRLAALEDKLEEIGRASFLERGGALREIRDWRLYRERYQTFEAYCAERWEWTPQHVNRLIAAINCVEEMEPMGSTVPARERHVRSLLELKSTDHRCQAWNTALKWAEEEGRNVKASDVEAAVKQLQAALDRDWVTLQEWELLDPTERAGFLSLRSGDKQFNKQDNASIEWARWSWNPITGCKHDCSYCYARDIAERFYPQKFEPSLYPGRLVAPAKTSVPAAADADTSYQNVFTGSMADMFGRWVPDEWIKTVFSVVAESPQWNFLFLTKFPKRMTQFDYPENAWLGTSVDCQARVKAAEDAFENVRSGTKWLSVEPMLEPLKFTRLHLFDWIVIGGASASTKTPAWVPPLDWVVNLHTQAREAGCAIYYKDNSGLSDSLRIREFPWENAKVKKLPDAFKYMASIK